MTAEPETTQAYLRSTAGDLSSGSFGSVLATPMFGWLKTLASALKQKRRWPVPERSSTTVAVHQQDGRLRHNVLQRRELLLSKADISLDALLAGAIPVQTLFLPAAEEVSKLQ
jgi:hypothetical protein